MALSYQAHALSKKPHPKQHEPPNLFLLIKELPVLLTLCQVPVAILNVLGR